MKKVIVLLLTILVVLASMSGCTSRKYGTIHIHQKPYTTAELVDISEEIFEGTVTDIFFVAMDKNNNIAPGPYHKGSGNVNTDTLRQYTIYEITTQTVYKGSEGEKKYIRIKGGILDYREEDQLKTLKQSGMPKDEQIIRVLDGAKVLEIGEAYLFVTRRIDSISYLSAPHAEQFAFEIAPETTDPGPTIGEDDPDPDKTVSDDPTYQKIIDYLKKQTES